MLERGIPITNNGEGLRAMLRSGISVPGKGTETVKLTSGGELNTTYYLYNFVVSKDRGVWRAVGNWDAAAQRLVLSGPMPGCECNGWSPPEWKGFGVSCG